jgi:hypothetical protein
MIPVDARLYQQVKSEADKKFLAPTSIYKSAWIVKTYKRRGGTFKDKQDADKGLLRWFREKWVDLNRPGEACGRSKATTKGVYPLCRPSIRVTKETPRLASEIGNAAMKKAKKEKQKVKQKKHIKF